MRSDDEERNLELGDVLATTARSLGGGALVFFAGALFANALALLGRYGIERWRVGKYAEVAGALTTSARSTGYDEYGYGYDVYDDYDASYGAIDLDDLMRHSALALLGIVLVKALGVVMTQAVILYPLVEQLNGRRPELGASLGKGVGRIPAALGALVVVSCTVMFTSGCLAIPGLACALLFSLAVPAAILEGLPPFRAIGRSVSLVGKNWAIILIVVAGLALSFEAIDLGVRLAFDATPLFVWSIEDLPETPPSWTYYVVSAAVFVLEAVVVAVASGVVYARLREEDGVDAEALAEVFA